MSFNPFRRQAVLKIAVLAMIYLSGQHVIAAHPLYSSVHPIADSNSLKQALTDYMEKVDSGKYAEVIPCYDSGFLSIRVVDTGPFIKMNYSQMVYFWKMQISKQTANSFNHRAIATQKTTILYLEILGDTSCVLLTRIKDLGNGPEPIFYNLTWINKNGKWLLFREIVHQRTLPNLH
jgi:hypothetical protein